MKPATPKPVIVTTICSECGLAWDAHGDKPSTSDCVRLLKAELLNRPAPILLNRPAPITITYPYVQPYPWYQYTWTNGIQNTSTITPINRTTTNTVDYKTPMVSNTCSAISA